ncbi:hypothetical protein WG219_17500 [Ectopseudomonas mendocina]|uniref:4-hydroxy-3-methylbut-2-enyl diphosphate reductase n=1 Tax=Ectopseudomonas mendocina TaxID=300 RepID=A0ABZ2RDG2_ECTME
MGVYLWARQEIEHCLQAAQLNGIDEHLALRALLSAVVERSKSIRDIGDLADELKFIADNLDDEREYGFMRP